MLKNNWHKLSSSFYFNHQSTIQSEHKKFCTKQKDLINVLLWQTGWVENKPALKTEGQQGPPKWLTLSVKFLGIL